MSRLINYYGDYDKPVPEHIGGEARELTCDLAIIGGGGAGLSAAVRAAEKGAKVVLIEKMSELGGNTRMAAGLLCTNSEILKAEGFPDTTEEHIDIYRREQKYRLDPAIYERFIRNTGAYYDWLASKGLDTENKRVVMDKVVMIRDRSTWEPLYNPAYGPGLMGSAVTDLLGHIAEESDNIHILLGTAATVLALVGLEVLRFLGRRIHTRSSYLVFLIRNRSQLIKFTEELHNNNFLITSYSVNSEKSGMDEYLRVRMWLRTRTPSGKNPVLLFIQQFPEIEIERLE